MTRSLPTLFLLLCLSFGPHALEAIVLALALGPIVWLARRIARGMREVVA